MITNYAQTRLRTITTITVTSSLSGLVYYHWYRDGAWIVRTKEPTYSFQLSATARAAIEVLDTVDPNWDGEANAPTAYPAARTLFWTRSTDTDVAYYRIEQDKDGGGYATIGKVFHVASEWSYRFVTPRLTDLSAYTWRIYPVDAAGDDGTVLEIGPDTIVRTPDAPDFAIAYDAETDKVTWTEAA